MSYAQAPFPQTAYGAPNAPFPGQQQQPQQQQYAQSGWSTNPSQPPPNNDFNFYSPPQPMHTQQPQQQQQPPQSFQPQPHMPNDGWNQEGARLRPTMQPVASPGGSVDPNAVAFMPQQLMTNPMAGMALDYGKASLAKNLSWVMSFLSSLKYYFHVNNRYVLMKLKVLLLPFLHSNWKRERMDVVGGVGGGVGSSDDGSIMSGLVGTPIYKAPRDDVNAPDLYIPTMAFITFTLVMGYALGIGNQFHPEVLGITASRNLILLFFEVLGLKGGLYLISVGPITPTTSLFDLISYASYKYIHCILMILIGLILGSWCFYGSILILGTLAALFMMRTMKRVCTPTLPSSNGGSQLNGDIHGASAMVGGYSLGNGSTFGQGKHRRNYFLLLIGGIQILFSWFLVRTANTGF